VEWPRITVVTPSYNQAQYLPETIESVLNQEYPNLEYIIVDGGSTDGSVEIIKRYERYLAYWVSEKDSGQSDAINKGFGKSTGRLFNWINSDDVLFPGALYRIAQAYRARPDAALIAGGHARCDCHGRVRRISVPPSRRAITPESWVIAVGQESTFVASEMFRLVGGVREDLHCKMDADLYYRVFAAGGRYVRASGLVGMIREHPAAKGTANREDWAVEERQLFDEYAIVRTRHDTAKRWLRVGRSLDGSYLRSFVMSIRWKGRTPWGGECVDRARIAGGGAEAVL